MTFELHNGVTQRGNTPERQQHIDIVLKCFKYVLNEWWESNRLRLDAFAHCIFNVLWSCGCVSNMFWTCFQCVWWGSKLNHTFFGRKNIVEKRRTDWNPCFLYWFSLKQMQEGIWVEKKLQIRPKRYWTHSLQRSGRKVEATTKNRNRASAKSNGDFCWFLDPKQRFFYKIQLFLGWLLRVYLNQVFSAYI